MTVASSLAEYLQGPAYWRSAVDAATLAAWGERGREASLMSPYDAAAAADAEGARQLAFLKCPCVEETVSVAQVGIRDQLRGRCAMIVADAPGYGGAGALCFVLGGTESEAEGITVLQVLRRL